MSASDGTVDAAAERSVEAELQARRDAFSLDISRYIARVNGAVSILLGILWFLTQADPQLLIYAVLTLLLALGAGVYPTLQRQNRTTAGVYLVYGLSLLLIALSPLLIPSLMAVVGITDVIAMMAAIMLLGARRSRGLMGALALAYLADVVGVIILGWRPFPPLEQSTERWVTGAVGLVVILTAIVVIRVIVLGLEQQFRRAQQLNLELEQQIQKVNETQATLRRERNLLRTLIDAIPASVYFKDTQSRFVDANLATALQLGVKTSHDLIGKTDFDFFTPQLAGKYLANEQALLQSGQLLHNIEEPSFDHRTQQENWLLTTEVPILDEGGTVTGLVGVSLDITKRKWIEQALEQERTLLRTLIDAMPDYIYIKDRESRFVIGNIATALSLGAASPDAIVGKTDFDFHPPDLAARFFEEEQALFQSGKPLLNHEELVIDQRTGEWQLLLSTNVPLYDSQGQITGLVGINRDITERKRAETQAFALAAEQQRVKLLREFIVDVSHDFRTPLSTIGTSTYLIGKTTDPGKRTQYCQRIEEQISRLSLLLDNFVQLADLEQQASALQFQPANVEDLVKTILEQRSREVTMKHQSLEYQSETPSVLVLGDPTALTKAIANVVSNALQYTPAEGKITLRLYHVGENAVIAVADTGIGIPAADLPYIFDSFYRVDSARSPESGGAGLGLSIAKRIVELMKGHIEVESEVGAGSVFKIYLPIYP